MMSRHAHAPVWTNPHRASERMGVAGGLRICIDGPQLQRGGEAAYQAVGGVAASAADAEDIEPEWEHGETPVER